MAEKLHILVAQSEIRRLISIYCDAVARRDADAIGPLFLPDAEVQIADLPLRVGTVQIVEGFRHTLSKFSFLQQSCDTGLIDVDGDWARARIGVAEFNRPIETDRVNFMFGQYEDEYHLSEAGWRFNRRRFSMRFLAAVNASNLDEFSVPANAFTFLLPSEVSATAS